MGRPRQVNVRVPLETFDVLEAAVFVRRLRGFQDLLAPVLESTAAQLERDEAVRKALNARRSANGSAS